MDDGDRLSQTALERPRSLESERNLSRRPISELSISHSVPQKRCQLVPQISSLNCHSLGPPVRSITAPGGSGYDEGRPIPVPTRPTHTAHGATTPRVVVRTENKPCWGLLPMISRTTCRLFSAFLHEAKLLNLRGEAIDNVPRFRSESG